MTTTLITGANRGIGLALAQASAARGERVVAVCRSASPELKALDARIVEGIDVTRRDDLSRLAAALADERLDRMFVNAGVLSQEALGEIDADAEAAIRQQFEVNALAPVLTVQALLDRLADGARIGIVTSRMGSMADNGSGGYYGYRMSKAAVNAAGRSLAIDLKPRGIAVALLHPGYVRTRMTGDRGEISAEQAAAGLIARLDALSLAGSGGFWHSNGETLPW
jgi:NAD(P)-dependent dehydrogenase (short-subunit alcohol dehydrogenase family)